MGELWGFFLIRFAAGREREREGRRKKEGEGGLTLFTRRSNSGFRIEIRDKEGTVSSDFRNGLFLAYFYF